MADIERIYTIPLRKAFDFPRTKRASKAITIVKNFLAKHMKVTVEHVSVSEAVNSAIWQRGIQKPPRRIKIKVTKEGDKAVARLIDEKIIKKQEKKQEKPKEEKPKEEKSEAEIESEEKEKEIKKEIQKQQIRSAEPKKELIKDLKK
ncbi:MAG: 50S ribosomal protein L31e [Candidatus Micrarchaeia archaeon]|jgi:large subunit ribosomal protein L31e